VGRLRLRRSSPAPRATDESTVPEPRDIVDIEGLRPPQDDAASAAAAAPGGATPKPFLMIWFRCCATYGRLPKSPDGLSYAGRCPKCLAKLEVPVGEGGTKRRMFEAQ
jgi:hypothetical protein